MVNIENGTKSCSGCKLIKNINEFGVRSNSGRPKSQCIECEKAYNKKYTEEHKEEKRAYDQKYYEDHKEEIKIKTKIHRDNNKEYYRLYNKQYREDNIEKLILYNKKYHANNRERLNARSRAYYRENKERLLQDKKQYNLDHRKEIKRYQRDHKRERMASDPIYKLHITVSRSINQRMKTNGGSKAGQLTWDNLPYTEEELWAHLEAQFSLPENLTPDGKVWMTRDNWKKYNPKTWKDDDYRTWTWNLDHIIPQSDLPYDNFNHPNFLKCWALSNLRPLKSKDNIIDGARRSRHQ